jgi:CheY-like chemotaxis protein/ketosteroid isomerase-like protein
VFDWLSNEVGTAVTDSTRQHRILVVEDDADIADSLSMALTSEEYEVSLASGPSQAVQLIEENTYDLILSDLFGSQPGRVLDSIEVMRERAHPTPVGILTGWTIDPEEAEQVGFSFVMRKPFDLDDLISRVAAAIHIPLSVEQQAQAETVHAYFARLSARDWDGFAALCTEDIVYVLPGSSPFAGTIEGRAAFREYTGQTFAQFPDTLFQDIRIYSTPHGLATRYKGNWRQPDGAPASMTGALIFQFRGRLIARIGVRLDDMRLRSLIGR